MQCLLFRIGAQMTKVSLPAHGDPPPWLEVDGVVYRLNGRHDGPYVYQEREPVFPQGLAYHIDDGVGEDSPATASSVKYFKTKIADLESRLNESVKREGRLREEIQRIQLRLADAYKNVVTLEVHEEEVARLRGIIAENVRDLNASQRGWIKALAAQEAEIALLKSDLKVGTDLRRQLQAEIDVLLKRAEVTDRTPSPLT